MHKNKFSLIKALTFLLLLTLWACVDHSSSEIHTQETKENAGLVLVIQDSTTYDTFRKKQAKLKYIDDHLIPQVLSLDTAKNRQAWVIPTQRDWQEIAYQDKHLITQHFLFRHGDSLLLTLKDKAPFFKVLNRKPYPFDINYEKKRNEQLYGGRPSPLEDFYHLWHLTNNQLSVVQGHEMADELQQLKAKAVQGLTSENQWRDSLLHQQLISIVVAEFYQTKNAFELEKLKLYQPDSINFSRQNLIQKLFTNQPDSTQNLLTYSYYDDLLTLFYEHHLLPQVSPESITDLYNTIREDELLSDEVRSALLLKHMEYTLPTLSEQAAAQYVSQFRQDSKDTFRTNYLKDLFKINFQYSKDIHLQTLTEQLLNFEQVLNENKGKVIYVDFWASWCLPCISALPALQQLHDDYPAEVVFLYLSTDEDADAWKRSVQAHPLFNKDYSFRIDRHFRSDLMEKLPFNTIPHYLLYNREGKLIHKNAPGPKTTAIRKWLDQLSEKQNNFSSGI